MTSTGADISLGRTRARSLVLHHASAGLRGRPLVLFLHGFPEAWFAWEAQLRDLGRDCFAVAPDLPGYNLSDKPADPRAYRAQSVVAELAAFVEALGYRECMLVGHDWGAAIAYAFAMARPDMVRRLCIVNGVHPWTFWRELVHNPQQAAHSAYMNELRLAPDILSRIARDDHAWLRAFLAPAGQVPEWFDAKAQARYRAAWSQPGAMEGGIAYYRASPLYPATPQDPGAARLQLDPATMQVTVPTRVLWGEQDAFLLPGCLDGLEQVVPQLALYRYPQGSHWLVHEMPQEVNRHLRAHLAAAA